MAVSLGDTLPACVCLCVCVCVHMCVCVHARVHACVCEYYGYVCLHCTCMPARVLASKSLENKAVIVNKTRFHTHTELSEDTRDTLLWAWLV